jgi:signal transduction histidine kinase
VTDSRSATLEGRAADNWLNERLAVLGAVSREAGRIDDLERFFRFLHGQLSRIFDATGFIFGVYDDANETITVVRQVDSGKELPGGSFPLGSGFTSQVIRTREPLLIRRWSEDGPHVRVQYATDRAGLPESGMTVPLLIAGRVVGFLSLQSYRAGAYDERDLAIFEAIATQVAAAVEGRRHSAEVDDEFQRRLSQLEAVLAGMSDALLIVDAAGRLVRLNRAARELLGVDESTGGIVLGEPLDGELSSWWPGGSPELGTALRPLVSAVRRGEPLSDVEVETQAGGRRVLSFSSTPLRDAAGELRGGIVVFRDITSRRIVERLKDEVLQIASHDLKTPVTVMKGYARRLRRRLEQGTVDAEELAAGLSTIDQESDHLVSLLDLLLDFSMVEAGRLELERRLADIVPLARGALASVGATTERHQVALDAHAEAVAECDAARIEQVLLNLLANAVKYSPDGGTVSVSVRADEADVTVSVRDEGIGIDPGEIGLIFERFYRAEGARRLEGSGLGLYICRAIVSAHGGQIWAESDGPGCGSRFSFSLPRRLPAGASPEAP